MAIAGFILSILGFLGGFIPIVGWILWLLGIIFSGIGLRRQPKGLAVAGIVISIISMLIIVTIYVLAFTIRR